MNKYKKKSWFIFALVAPLCLILFVGGAISFVHYETVAFLMFPPMGIGIACFGMFKISSFERMSNKHDVMIEGKKKYCNANGYLFVENKKEVS
jgi:hypothetical protein